MKQSKAKKEEKLPFKVFGPRLLLRVTKIKKAEIEKFEGSSLYKPDFDTGKEALNVAVASQCTAVIVALGDTAYRRKDAWCDGTPWTAVGDTVTFARYGAQRMADKYEDYEYWIIRDIDVLAKVED